MRYLLYHKTSATTAKVLAKKLELEVSSKLLSDYPTIRYGNSSNPLSIDTPYNSPDSIRTCSNSIKFSNFCREYGFNSPIYTRLEDMDRSEIEYPFLVRRKYHKSGADIVFIQDEGGLHQFIDERGSDGFYHVPFIKTSYEIRVHVINNRVVRLFRKQKDGEDNYIRSTKFGWSYSLRTTKYTKAKELAVNLATALDIYFVAFDMAWNKYKREYVVWEANSAPGLNNTTLDVYADLLREVI